ncbi:hypothetical protein FRC12_003682 [Ceratobasidium sp. 428]|nr:hypothetical protein FRC12_003682 [Ceratobasidium sp. 428]
MSTKGNFLTRARTDKNVMNHLFLYFAWRDSGCDEGIDFDDWLLTRNIKPETFDANLSDLSNEGAPPTLGRPSDPPDNNEQQERDWSIERRAPESSKRHLEASEARSSKKARTTTQDISSSTVSTKPTHYKTQTRIVCACIATDLNLLIQYKVPQNLLLARVHTALVARLLLTACRPLVARPFVSLPPLPNPRRPLAAAHALIRQHLNPDAQKGERGQKI